MDNKETIKEIIEVSNNIRKKYKALKRGLAENDKILEETFKPITSPLLDIVTNTKNKFNETVIADNVFTTPVFSKSKQKRDKKFSRETELYSTPKHSTLIEPKKKLFASPVPFLETDVIAVKEEDVSPIVAIKSKVGTPNEELPVLVEKFGEIAAPYLYHFATSSDVDKQYGLRLDSNGDFMIGNTPVEIDHNDLKIGDSWYEGTYGLYELLFKKRPVAYTAEDKNKYLEIVFRTNTHRKNYKDTGQLSGNRSFKYMKIIKPAIQTGKSKSIGHGLMNFTKFKREYVYWDDPNEIVDRLRLLLASKTAGHTGHDNEIMSIIEELKEANIIE